MIHLYSALKQNLEAVTKLKMTARCKQLITQDADWYQRKTEKFVQQDDECFGRGRDEWKKQDGK